MEFQILNDDLQELRVAYERGDDPVYMVCNRFSISRTRLYQFVRLHNWQKRSEKNSSQQTLTKNQPAPLETLASLRKIARQYVSDLENEINRKDDISSSDRERSVRSLRTLLKIIEDIVELENRFIPSADEGNRKEIDSKQRQELARRIKALRTRD